MDERLKPCGKPRCPRLGCPSCAFCMERRTRPDRRSSSKAVSVVGATGTREYDGVSLPSGDRRKALRGSLVQPMLKTREVSELLGVHITTVRRWSNNGTLRSYRISERGDCRFRREDVELIAARLKSSNHPTDISPTGTAYDNQNLKSHKLPSECAREVPDEASLVSPD